MASSWWCSREGLTTWPGKAPSPTWICADVGYNGFEAHGCLAIRQQRRLDHDGPPGHGEPEGCWHLLPLNWLLNHLLTISGHTGPRCHLPNVCSQSHPVKCLAMPFPPGPQAGIKWPSRSAGMNASPVPPTSTCPRPVSTCIRGLFAEVEIMMCARRVVDSIQRAHTQR